MEHPVQSWTVGVMTNIRTTHKRDTNKYSSTKLNVICLSMLITSFCPYYVLYTIFIQCDAFDLVVVEY
jgi:hypothetical protein